MDSAEVDSVLSAAALVVAGCALGGSEIVLAPEVAAGIARLRRGIVVELVTSSWKTPSSAMLHISAAGRLGWEWEGAGTGSGTPVEGELLRAEANEDGRLRLIVRLPSASAPAVATASTAPATPPCSPSANGPAGLVAPAGSPLRRTGSFDRVRTDLKRRF
eukprot:5218740-Prymnesium_polylepis.1